MAEKIYTIPINDTFDKKCGCPLCSLRADLESASLEYIMGAAMMEPDVRIETNRHGFCRRHFDEMLGMKNRLSLALMLESHLAELGELVAPAPGGRKKPSRIRKNESDGSGPKLTAAASSCFVCRRVAGFEEKYLDNICYMWKKEPEFREKLAAQEFFCLEHHGALLETAKGAMSDEQYTSLLDTLSRIQGAYLEKLAGDVTAFCRSFDHRNAAHALGEEEKSAVNRAVDFLAGRERR